MQSLYPDFGRNKTTRRLAFWFVFLIPVAIFYIIHLQMAVNVPFQDDFDGLLDPTTKLAGSWDSLAEFWKVLSTQDDERRIVMDRLLSFGFFKLEGQLYLPHLMLFGSASYLAFLALIVAWFRQHREVSPYLLLVIPYLLFIQNNYGALYWPIVVNQHITVYIWAFVSLWFVSRPSAFDYVAALFFAIVALYSDVTGAIILVAGGGVLLLQKQYKRLIIWAVVMGTLCFFYFYKLTVPEFRPSIGDNLSHYDSLLSMIVLMPGFFADVMISLPYQIRLGIAAVFGLMSLALVFYCFFELLRKYQTLNRYKPESSVLWLWGCLFFLAATFGMLALGRAAEGIPTIMINRYRHLFTFWLIFNFLLLIQYTSVFKGGWRPWQYWTLIVAAMGYFFLHYFENQANSDYYRKELLTDAYEWKNNRAIPTTGIYLSLRESVDNSYINALKAGVYHFPHFPFGNLPKAPVQGTIAVDIIDNEGTYQVYIPEFERGFGKNDGAYLILESPQNTHILPTKNTHYALRWSLLKGKYYAPGATSGAMMKQYLTAPRYNVKIGVIRGGKQYIMNTGKVLIPNPS